VWRSTERLADQLSIMLLGWGACQAHNPAMSSSASWLTLLELTTFDSGCGENDGNRRFMLAANLRPSAYVLRVGVPIMEQIL
jgi:hypothetical protein